jgi:hypothetical protein
MSWEAPILGTRVLSYFGYPLGLAFDPHTFNGDSMDGGCLGC